MESSNQLAIIDLQQLQIPVYGDVIQPLFECKDVMIKLLGYRDCYQANWFEKMVENPRFVNTCESQGQRFFTEIGLYKALFKSNKSIAEQFQNQVAELLVQLRLQQREKNLQLEEQNKQLQIQIQQTIKVGVIYRIYYKKDPSKFYVGLHEGDDANTRLQTHKKDSIASVKLPLYRFILIVGWDLFDIEILETVKYQDFNYLLERETYWRQHLNSPLNNGYQYQCDKCKKIIRQPAAIDKHIKKCV